MALTMKVHRTTPAWATTLTTSTTPGSLLTQEGLRRGILPSADPPGTAVTKYDSVAVHDQVQHRMATPDRELMPRQFNLQQHYSVLQSRVNREILK